MSPAAKKTTTSKSALPDTLTNEHILLTGATGFVGQAILERLLSSFPDTRISTLIRPKGSVTGEQRLQNLLRKPVFKAWIEQVGEDEAKRQMSERVSVVGGSLESVESLPGDLDVVIHSASTVSFDPPIDEAFDTNVGGAIGLYGALLKSGSDPHVVHISTCYVGGIRKGIQPESALTHNVDVLAEYEAAKSARDRVELESRQPDQLRQFLSASKARNGKAGPQAVAAFAEAARVDWVRERLVDHGRTRAESLGWTDVYTLTKAFAERIAEDRWGKAGHRLSVVRPSIIESALHHPFPGWIDGFKVADPLIIAYGRGQLPEFPGLPDSVLDVIPVDFVVNAVVAAAGKRAEVDAPKYYHVASGASNPLPFHTMYELVHEYFTANPLPDDERGSIRVPTWKFPGGLRVERELARQERMAAKREARVGRSRRSPKNRARLDRIKSRKHDLEVLRGFTELYRAYVQTEIIFDDDNTKALHASLPKAAQADRGFDVDEIDWHDYFMKVHFPAITTLTRVFASRPAAKSARTASLLPARNDVLAVFDLEGTVLESNLVKQYLMLWAGSVPRSRWPHDLFDFLLKGRSYLKAERRDRGEFIRTFMRRYKGFKVAEIQSLVAGSVGKALMRRAYPDALRRVAEHRAAGHRTILVTGTIDLMVEPFRPYFDEVVAGRMHERDGVLTGYLADPPLVDEARGAWIRRYAAKHGYDLAGSYGYGDSHADLVWLQLLGHPTAVNPDLTLYRHAQEKRWNVLDWTRRSATPAPNDVVSPASVDEEGVGTAVETARPTASHGV